MKSFLVLSLLSLTLSSFASERTTVKGIVCTGTNVNGIKPFVIIKNISSTRATLILDMNNGLPDIRNAVLDKVVNNGKLLVGYISENSEINPKASNFSVYTNGSTPKDTTKAVLAFEDRDIEIEMTCRNGMDIQD